MTPTRAESTPSNGLTLFPALIALLLPNAIVYGIQLARTNAYAGFEVIQFDTSYCVRLAVSMMPLLALVPMHPKKPSDHFYILYGLFVVFNFSMFHVVEGEVAAQTYYIRYLVLLFPMLFIKLGDILEFRFSFPPLLKFWQLELGIALICTLVGVIVLTKAPASAGFGIDDVYDRRLQGREIFSPGSPLSYLSSIVINGFAPFLAFIAGVTGRTRLLLLSVTLAVVYFYVVGVKSALPFIALAYFFGRGMRYSNDGAVIKLLISATILAFAIFVFEILFNQFSAAAEFYFRRIFVIPAHVVQQYFDMMSAGSPAKWSWLSGVDAPTGVTFLVGKLYYLSDAANVNANTFVDSLGARGIPGFLINLGLVWIVYSWLDSMYRSARNPAYLFVGLIFSLLITEQAASTALVSSGMGILIVLLAVTASPEFKQIGEDVR